MLRRRRSSCLSSPDYASPAASTESHQCAGDATVVRGPLMEAGVLRSVQLVVVMKQWHSWRCCSVAAASPPRCCHCGWGGRGRRGEVSSHLLKISTKRKRREINKPPPFSPYTLFHDLRDSGPRVRPSPEAHERERCPE